MRILVASLMSLVVVGGDARAGDDLDLGKRAAAIVLPEFSVHDASLREAVNVLLTKALEVSPDATWLKVVVNETWPDTWRPDHLTQSEVKSVAALGRRWKTAHRLKSNSLTIALRQIPVPEALKFLASAAGGGYDVLPDHFEVGLLPPVVHVYRLADGVSYAGGYHVVKEDVWPEQPAGKIVSTYECLYFTWEFLSWSPDTKVLIVLGRRADLEDLDKCFTEDQLVLGVRRPTTETRTTRSSELPPAGADGGRSP